MSKPSKFSKFVQGRSPVKKKDDNNSPVFVDHLQNVRNSIKKDNFNEYFNSLINFISKQTRDYKNRIKNGTGLVYDEKMTEHLCLWDPNYPECPERFTRVIDRLTDCLIMFVGVLTNDNCQSQVQGIQID